MAYREDLDAALARNDALQHHCDQLASENTRLRREIASGAPAPIVIDRPASPRVSMLGALVMLVAGILAGMGIALRLETSNATAYCITSGTTPVPACTSAAPDTASTQALDDRIAPGR